MRRFLFIVTMLLIMGAEISAQVSTQNARRMRSGTATNPNSPALPCSPGPPYTDEYDSTTDHSKWLCTTAPSTWSKIVSGGTPVSGTVTQNTVTKGGASNTVTDSGTTDNGTTITSKLTETPPGAATTALAGAGAGNVDNGAHTVWVTCVTAGGQTSQGTASNVTTVADKTVNGKIAITGIPTCSRLATGRDVYMSTVAAPTVAKLLSNGTIADNTTTTLTANDSDATLAAAATAPSTNTAIDARLTVGQSTTTIVGNVMANNGNVSLGANTSPAIKTKVVVGLNGASGAVAPTTVSLANNYLQIGSLEYNASAYRLIGFGYSDPNNTYFPAYIGFQDASVVAGQIKGDLIFGTRNVTTDTQPTERMRIAADGQITMPGLASSSAATTGTVCWTAGTGLLNVDTTTTCLLSARKFKKDINPLRNNLNTVLRLRPVSYFLKDDPTSIGRQEGLIADDVAKVDRDLVSFDSNGEPHAVRYQQLTGRLLGAIQELNAKVDLLSAKVQAQQKTIQRLRRHR